MNDMSVNAIRSTTDGMMAYCKFLSANDSGYTGAHQSGILISIRAKEILFDCALDENIIKRKADILWNDNVQTTSTFTYYQSKRELRITGFGRDFPYLNPDQVGSLFVLVRCGASTYKAYFLDTEEEIDLFLSAFGINPVETNRIIEKRNTEIQEQAAINAFISTIDLDFPSSYVMSDTARRIYDSLYRHSNQIVTNPDKILIDWTDMEYKIFRALEVHQYGAKISSGFSSVDEFVNIANQVLNRRKSRAGKSLEHHLASLFDGNGVCYTAQAQTEGNKKPDFIFPSQDAYHTLSFPVEGLISLGAKTTCKDRWRQVINEADRLRNRTKFLATLQQGISLAQMDEMSAEKVVLVVPKQYISSYPSEAKDRIWTIKKFIEYAKEVEGTYQMRT